MRTSIQEKYRKEIVPELKKKLGLENVNAVPKVKAIVINVGIGSHVAAGKDYEDMVKSVTSITGQKPVITHSKKAISNFKLKINMPSGIVATLRGKRMYDFLTKLIHVVFPRIRDFRGISPKSFDGRGNYSLGIREHIVFPEIQSEDVGKIHGLQITIQTSAGTNENGLALLKAFGFPFKK
ncbi:50S ribosomal protein L5 [Candidatus Peregrinibacteria bacterium]|nr:50S ribosomal protein L5 [Candidatus Peregrinibacteria bacterium]